MIYRLLGSLSMVTLLASTPVSGRSDTNDSETTQGDASHEQAHKDKKVDDGKHHQILKGAVAGAVAGHYAGHHAVKGAIVGATAGAIKRHHDKKVAKKAAAEANEPAR